MESKCSCLRTISNNPEIKNWLIFTTKTVFISSYWLEKLRIIIVNLNKIIIFFACLTGYKHRWCSATIKCSVRGFGWHDKICGEK